MTAARHAWRSWAQTDVGAVRNRNEDAFVNRPEVGLWAVADGAGGHDHGEMASTMLADALMKAAGNGSDLVAEVRACVARTHQALRERAEAEAASAGHGVMIASTVVVFLASGPHYACFWAGDSRAYRLRAGRMDQLTRDHSLVQVLVDNGSLTLEEAEKHPHANVITRAIGADGPPPELDKVTDRAEPRDRFVLCSDGLTKSLSESHIARLAASQDPARHLIAAALEHGVRDNVTAVVLEFGGTEPDPDDTLMRRSV